MKPQFNFENILFLDIETVPEVPNFVDLPLSKQEMFADKTSYQRKDEITAEDFYNRAGIWAEFGKIVCISIGYFTNFNLPNRSFRVKSLYGEEVQILEEFKQLLDTHFNKPEHLLCAHNGKEFDFPFIARRMIIHAISLPEKLNLFGKKPWEITHLDTMELWKFGDYKHFTSLKLLTNILGIPSPKNDIDGSMVGEVYYKEKNIKRIVEYCEKDTVAVAQVLLRLFNMSLLNPEDIISV
jgi:uncharacterized protein YprB with RNaseH-like and TPR domain